jgi:two-component system nitrogen regulation sensor histidine kinase NtrY
MGQALINLVKNAGEAIETRRERGDAFDGRIEVTLASDGQNATLTISDNGIGLPPDRARLFEPYVTTRAKGTGLGLPIVRKIIEEHDGTLRLTDAPDRGDGHRGACAEIVLPVAAGAETQPERIAAAGGAT